MEDRKNVQKTSSGFIKPRMTTEGGESRFADFEAGNWAQKYPSIAPKVATPRWQRSHPVLRLPTSSAQIIYTTNAI